MTVFCVEWFIHQSQNGFLQQATASFPTHTKRFLGEDAAAAFKSELIRAAKILGLESSLSALVRPEDVE